MSAIMTPTSTSNSPQGGDQPIQPVADYEGPLNGNLADDSFGGAVDKAICDYPETRNGD